MSSELVGVAGLSVDETARRERLRAGGKFGEVFTHEKK